MFNINDNLRCAVFINDKEFLLDQGNTMQVLHISASTLKKLPALHIQFLDALNIMSEYGLQDGSLIKIVLDGTYQYVRTFRVLHWKPQAVGSGFQYKVDGIWDAPKYWAGTNCTGLVGTSANVVQQIANICGLKTYPGNAKTSDAMTWMQGNRSYSEFARTIARHGYVSATSHMMLAVDSLGFLRYLNVNDLKAEVIKTSMTPAQDELMLTDFSPSTRSGLNNVIGGYSYEVFSQQADAASTVSPLENELTLKSDAKYPMVNTEVRSKIERGPINYRPINFGNVHDNYDRARYQNLRFSLLNSVQGQFLYPFQTPLEPGNQLVFAQTPGLNNTRYNGRYTITEKIIFVQGSQYNEKLIGVRNALSE